MARVVVVSNRIPSTGTDRTASVGGLATGLLAALEEQGGVWLGWDGQKASGTDKPLAIRQHRPFLLAALSLTEQEVEGYYGGFANRVLWPLLHERIDLIRYDPADFAAYQAVNRKFAARLIELLQPEDLIWVHDYHLMPLGRQLRQAGISRPLGFFLHVPFPDPSQWAVLPHHRALIGDLAAYDLIGFQTERDERNFRAYVSRYLGGSVTRDGRVWVAGRGFRTGTFPIGIDAERFAARAASPRVRAMQTRLRRHFRDQRAVIGVDRLDYSKGLPERLQAFDRFLSNWPCYRRHCSLIQIAAPSRETVPEYRVLSDTVARLSASLNGRHGEFDWSPVRYLNRSFDQARLAALYRFSRVALVTPLRDGMNLVAKEYVAAQDATDPGVLVLSRFAGAACQLDAALLVNPHDIDAVAQALRRALNMPRSERVARWAELWHGVRNADVHDWRVRFLTALRQARSRMLPAVRSPGMAALGRPLWAVPATLTVARNNPSSASTEGLLKPLPGNPFRH